jgi:hypothetical protein
MKLKLFQVNKPKEQLCTFNCLSHNDRYLHMMHNEGKNRSASHNFFRTLTEEEIILLLNVGHSRLDLLQGLHVLLVIIANPNNFRQKFH